MNRTFVSEGIRYSPKFAKVFELYQVFICQTGLIFSFIYIYIYILLTNKVVHHGHLKKGHHFFFTKSLLKEATTFLLPNWFFSIGNIIMIPVIRIPMGSDPVPFFVNFFLTHEEAVWVKAHRKLETINVRKINNSLWFIDDLLSLNDDNTFGKHYRIFIQQN